MLSAAVYLRYDGPAATPVIVNNSTLHGKEMPVFISSPDYKINQTSRTLKSRVTSELPAGPYFVSLTGLVFKAHRLYADEQNAFLEPAVSDEQGGYLPLPATSEVCSMYSWLQ